MYIYICIYIYIHMPSTNYNMIFIQLRDVASECIGCLFPKLYYQVGTGCDQSPCTWRCPFCHGGTPSHHRITMT